jgi:hypothetical protein
MRLFKNIAFLTLVFWSIQFIAFVLFFGSFFTHLIVRCFVALGVGLPESSLEAFLTDAMKIVSWPIRLLFASAWADATVIKTLLLLAINGLIWGSAVGTMAFLFKRTSPTSGPAPQ